MWTLGLSSYVSEIPNDAYTTLNQNIAQHIWSCLHTTHISSVPALHITYFGKPEKLLCEVLKFYRLEHGACFCAGFTSWESATQISKYTYTILCIKTNTNVTNNNTKNADQFIYVLIEVFVPWENIKTIKRPHDIFGCNIFYNARDRIKINNPQYHKTYQSNFLHNRWRHDMISQKNSRFQSWSFRSSRESAIIMPNIREILE